MSIYQGLAKKSRWVPKIGGTIVDEIGGGVIGVCFLEIYCSGQHTDMPKVVIFGMNEVAVAWNGPRLWENGGTGSGKGFRCLRGFWEAIKK